MKDEVITLISQTQTVDEYGDPSITETQRTVFAGQQSIGMKEFYEAKATGYKPEIKLIMEDYLDYQGEPFLLYNGARYKVIRTYRKGQEIELTCSREVNRYVSPPTPTAGDGDSE